MSEQDVAAARRLLDGFMAGDLETAMSAIHADCVVHEAESLPYPGDWHGPDGFAKLLGIMAGCFDLRITAYQAWDCGDGMVSMRANATFASRTTGRSVDTSIVEIYRIADGQIIDADIFYKDAKAIHDLAAESSVPSGL